jgi:hypothetical protein
MAALIALLSLFAATRFVDGDSPARVAPVPDPTTPAAAYELTFDENGAPTIRLTEGDHGPQACRREANREVPSRTVLDAATAVASLRDRAQHATDAYDAFTRSHQEGLLSPAAAERYRRLKVAMLFAEERYNAAGARYNLLANEYRAAIRACLATVA